MNNKENKIDGKYSWLRIFGILCLVIIFIQGYVCIQYYLIITLGNFDIINFVLNTLIFFGALWTLLDLLPKDYLK